MKRIGFLLDDLGHGQLSWQLMRRIEESRSPGLDCILFTRYPSRPCLPLPCAAMTWREAWDYPGVVVATSYDSASFLLEFPQAQAKFFYLADLEWLRQKGRPYRDWAAIYQNPELSLVCRSTEHQLLVESLWGRQSQVVDIPGPTEFLGLL